MEKYVTQYIDGFILPVPRDQLKTYSEVVEKVAEVWKKLLSLQMGKSIKR